MFNVNEFNYHVNPLKPGKIVLELSKKSKKNLLIRQALLLIGIPAVLALGAAVANQVDDVQLKSDATTDPIKD